MQYYLRYTNFLPLLSYFIKYLWYIYFYNNNLNIKKEDKIKDKVKEVDWNSYIYVYKSKIYFKRVCQKTLKRLHINLTRSAVPSLYS